jgi:hypothetical protein
LYYQENSGDRPSPADYSVAIDILNLLTRLLLWLIIGYLLWWVVKKFIPTAFLTWLGGAILLALVAASFLERESTIVNTFWQVISFPLTPLGAVITFLGVSLANGLNKVNGRLVLIGLVILSISSTPLVARTLIDQSEGAVKRAYESQRALCSDICTVDDIPFNLARAMVVIGDNADAGLSSSLPSRIDSQVRLDPILVSRLNSAADVYRRLDGVNPWVTVTAGARTSGEQGKPLNEAIRQVLSARGVPADRVELINTGLDIHGVVEHQKKFLKDRGLFTPPAGNPRRQTQRNNREANRVVLVAPALTMRRAALAFEQQGLQVVAWPTELYGAGAVKEDSKLARLVDLVPNVAALWLTTRYWEELLTSLYYYLRGWLPPFTMQWDGVIEVIETLP